MSARLPVGWSRHASTRHPGSHYFVHEASGKRQWTVPTTVDACRAHYDAQARERRTERQQSRILGLRRANNRVKARLITHALDLACAIVGRQRPIVLLDLGCGKGGDLQKVSRWAQENKCDVHLYAVDLSSASIDEMQSRWRALQPKCSFLRVETAVGDFCAPENRHLPASWPAADIVSVQFALHYAFESISSARRFGDNVGRMLDSQHGILIGTLFDDSRLRQFLSTTAADGGLSGGAGCDDDICSVSVSSANARRWQENENYGIGCHVTLDGCLADCREYVVKKAALERLLAPLGLVCNQWWTFDAWNEAKNLTEAENDVHRLYAAFLFAKVQ